MATSAFQTVYRQEIISGFDKTQSILRDTVTTEFMEQGSQAVFLVSDTINQTSRTRGLNGLIPADPLALTQNTATLTPWHKLVTVNDFNMFASQGSLTKPMQEATMAAINRKIDDDLITTLNTATVTTGAATTASLMLIAKAKAILGKAKVAADGQLTALVTPAFMAYLIQTKEFGSADYVTARPLVDGGPSWGDKRMVYKWMGVTFIEDPTLPGIGTAAEKCFLFHKKSVGHAIKTQQIDFDMDYNREQKYSWANCSTFTGSVLLQNSGVVVMNHDGSAMIGS